MGPKRRIDDLPDFDMARQLRSEADIAAYVTMVIEEGDAAELAHALEAVAEVPIEPGRNVYHFRPTV